MEMQWVNLINFLIYLGIALPLLGLGIWAFLVSTPYKEFEIISAGGMGDLSKMSSAIAAALVLGGKVLGLCLVLASAIFHSVSPVDLIIWGLVGIGFQMGGYYLYELITPFKATIEIPKGNVAVGVLSAFLSVSTGLLLGALISY